MSWEVGFIDEAKRDMRKLDGSQRAMVIKAIKKVQKNPGAEGCGTPLGNKGGANPAGLVKVKLRKSGIRIVYQLVAEDGIMKIIVIGMRTDDEVYKEASKRLNR